jgi:hypothetical protein
MGGFLTPAQMQDAQLSDPLEDNDEDGRVNYLEYAFLYDPAVADGGSDLIVVPGANPAVSYIQRSDTEAPDYTVEFSTNLVSWTNNVAGQPAVTELVGAPVDQGNGSQRMTVHPVDAEPVGFFRLRVEPK